MQDFRNHKDVFIRMAGGDEEAYRELFHYFTPRLQHFVFGIVKSQDIAEEIVQDVMMKLWLHREEIPNLDNPSSWVYTIASNRSLSFLRRMSVERRYIDKVKVQIRQIQEQNLTEDSLTFRENEQLLNNAIKTLSPQQQMVYRLSKKEGFSRLEVSQKLGISPNTVKNHLVVAVRTIIAYIQKNGFLLFFKFFL